MRIIDLAVQAGKKRQSPRTKFVHYFPSDETATDVVSFYENFCFALGLFRLKTTESVLEGKDLVERLLAFQGEDGNLPVYLHDFPKCWDAHLGLKIAPVLVHILREFGMVLNAAYKEKLGEALAKMIKPPKNPIWEHRYQALLGNSTPMPDSLSHQEWFERIVSDQLVSFSATYPIPYHVDLQCFLGDHQTQEKSEPQPVIIEYLLAEGKGFGKRLLKDHSNQLYGALLYPFSSSEEITSPFCKSFGRFLWKGETLHSLVAPKGKWKEGKILFHLPDGVEMGRDDLFESLVYCDVSQETTILINQKRGMVFLVGDIISIQTPSLRINLRFEIESGEGEFCGHISRANRPGQIGAHGPCLYEAYDWQIGLRTLRRQGACTVAVFFSVE